jgi:hypothetical protein
LLKSENGFVDVFHFGEGEALEEVGLGIIGTALNKFI